jgi:hypothetical protein
MLPDRWMSCIVNSKAERHAAGFASRSFSPCAPQADHLQSCRNPASCPCCCLLCVRACRPVHLMPPP